MEERKSIIEGMITSSDWLQENDDVAIRVMCLYSKISEKFTKDIKYGPAFVEKNQSLIGRLVQAAMQEVQADIIAEAIRKTY